MSVLANCLVASLAFSGCAKTAPSPSESTATGSTAVDRLGTDATELGSVALASLKFTDIKSQSHEPFSVSETKAIVLVFIATDCPIANYYQPTLARMSESFANDDVLFFLVHADPDVELVAAEKHATEFNVGAPVIIDSDQLIAKSVNARVTPEAFLIDRDGKVQYRGRINDLYVDFGKRRRQPNTRDLHDAIESLIQGKEIRESKTKAIGCYIPYAKKEEIASPH